MDTNTTATTPTTTVTPPAGSRIGTPDDPRRLLAATVRTATGLMDAIRADQYDLPTPCEDMTVAELHEHLVMVLRRIACAGRGESVRTWPADAADVPRGEWLDAWRAAAVDAHLAWGDEVLDRPTELPWGVYPGTEVLGVYANEIAVHAWDLSRATGIDADWDPASLEFSLAAIHSQLPMADRTPMWEETKAQLPADVPWQDPFGPAVPVADDAPLIDRLVAWNGRSPSWSAPTS